MLALSTVGDAAVRVLSWVAEKRNSAISWRFGSHPGLDRVFLSGCRVSLAHLSVAGVGYTLWAHDGSWSPP